MSFRNRRHRRARALVFAVTLGGLAAAVAVASLIGWGIEPLEEPMPSAHDEEAESEDEGDADEDEEDADG